jgi:hypothetical protein
VRLTATPSPGFTLASWSGCDWTQGNICGYTIGSDHTVSANFTQPQVKVTSLVLQPTSVKGGNITIATVTINQPAPAGSMGIGMSSDHPLIVQPPTLVTVPAGRTSVSFAIRTVPVRVRTVANITAAANDSQTRATLTLTAGYETSQSSAKKRAPATNRSSQRNLDKNRSE